MLLQRVKNPGGAGRFNPAKPYSTVWTVAMLEWQRPYGRNHEEKRHV
jgi:hypothetical protein